MTPEILAPWAEPVWVDAVIGIPKALTILPGEDKIAALETIKKVMVELLKAEGRVQQRLVQAVRLIETEELWRVAADNDGVRYKSMTEYLPALLAELKSQGLTDSMGVRQMRTWLSADRVLVQSGLLDWEGVSAIGIGKVEKLLQATGYNPKTGEIAEDTTGTKKLNKEQFKNLLDEIQESPDTWTMAEVAKEADRRRGVVRAGVHIRWNKLYDGTWTVLDVYLNEGDESYVTPMTLEQARRVMSLLNATTNLPLEG